MKRSILFTLAACGLLSLQALSLRADGPTVSTRVLLYPAYSQYPEYFFAVLIQGQSVSGRQCSKPQPNDPLPSTPETITEYLSNRCHRLFSREYTSQNTYQTRSERFILSAQMPADSKLNDYFGNERGVITGSQTIVVDLKDPSTALMTYAMINHPEGKNPQVESDRSTFVLGSDTTIALPPFTEFTHHFPTRPTPYPSARPSYAPNHS